MNHTENINHNDFVNKTPETGITNIIEKNKNSVNITVSNSLADLFGLKKEHLSSTTKKETKDISNESEINYTEAALAKIFGKSDEMYELNREQEKKVSLSMAHVLQSLDTYQQFYGV